jgi:hypothetical protein
MSAGPVRVWSSPPLALRRVPGRRRERAGCRDHRSGGRAVATPPAAPPRDERNGLSRKAHGRCLRHGHPPRPRSQTGWSPEPGWGATSVPPSDRKAAVGSPAGQPTCTTLAPTGTASAPAWNTTESLHARPMPSAAQAIGTSPPRVGHGHRAELLAQQAVPSITGPSAHGCREPAADCPCRTSTSGSSRSPRAHDPGLLCPVSTAPPREQASACAASGRSGWDRTHHAPWRLRRRSRPAVPARSIRPAGPTTAHRGSGKGRSRRRQADRQPTGARVPIRPACGSNDCHTVQRAGPLAARPGDQQPSRARASARPACGLPLPLRRATCDAANPFSSPVVPAVPSSHRCRTVGAGKRESPHSPVRPAARRCRSAARSWPASPSGPAGRVDPDQPRAEPRPAWTGPCERPRRAAPARQWVRGGRCPGAEWAPAVPPRPTQDGASLGAEGPRYLLEAALAQSRVRSCRVPRCGRW